MTDRPGSALKTYIWAVRSVIFSGVFFHYDKGSRSQEVVLKMLKNFQGALQTDGYAAYSIYEEKLGVLPLGCMAHVRRKFENALTTTPEAQKALDYIALLYMLEGNLKEEGADYEQIRNEREHKAYPLLQQMESWMKKTYDSCTPKSPLGLAISYAFGMWPRISRYCKEGYFNIDNNGIENAIRPIKLGLKNYYSLEITAGQKITVYSIPCWGVAYKQVLSRINGSKLRSKKYRHLISNQLGRITSLNH